MLNGASAAQLRRRRMPARQVNEALTKKDHRRAIELASHLEATNDCAPFLCRDASMADGRHCVADHRRAYRLLHRDQDRTTQPSEKICEKSGAPK